MSNVLEYKGYHSKIEFDVEACVLRGKIEGINDYVDFESDTLENIVSEFHSAVDDYLEFCAEVGKAPEKEYKGTFNVRIDPKLHRAIAIDAMKKGISLNATVEKAIEHYLSNANTATQFLQSSIEVPSDQIRAGTPYVNSENYLFQNSKMILFNPDYRYQCKTMVVNN